jgi:hypothetical protein
MTAAQMPAAVLIRSGSIGTVAATILSGTAGSANIILDSALGREVLPLSVVQKAAANIDPLQI